MDFTFLFAVMVCVGLVALGPLLLLASAVNLGKRLAGDLFTSWAHVVVGTFLGVGFLAAAQLLGTYMGWWS